MRARATVLCACVYVCACANECAYLQSNTSRSLGAHASKRTAPQWQPPVCLTLPAISV